MEKGKKLANLVTEDMVKVAMKKRMYSFLTLYAAALIPDGTYASRQSLKNMLKDYPGAENYLHMSYVSNVATRGLLESVNPKNHPDALYKPVKSTIQGVYKITSAGLERFRQYIQDLQLDTAEEQKRGVTALASASSEKIHDASKKTLGDLLADFFKNMEKIAKQAQDDLEGWSEMMNAIRKPNDLHTEVNPPVNFLTINDAELSVRAWNCLKNAGIETINDLAQKTEREVLQMKHMGRKTLNELKKVLVEHGMSFKIN